MIRFSDLNRRDVFGVGYFVVPTRRIVANQNFPNYAYTNDYRVGWEMDYFVTSIMLDVPIGNISAWTLLERQSPLGNFYHDFTGYKPEKYDEADDLFDWRNYGSVLGALSAHTTSASSSSESRWGREHTVRHLTGRGYLQTLGVSRPLLNRSGLLRTWLGRSFRATGDWNGYLYQRIYPDLNVSYPDGDFAFTPNKVTAINYSTLAANGRYYLPHFCEDAKANGESVFSVTTVNGYARNVLRWWDFDYEHEATGPNSGIYRLTYTFENTASKTSTIPKPWLGNTMTRYAVKVEFGYSSNPNVDDQKVMLVGSQRIKAGLVTSFKRSYVLTKLTFDVKAPPAGYSWPTQDGASTAATTSIAHVTDLPNRVKKSERVGPEDYGCRLLTDGDAKVCAAFDDFIDVVHPRIRRASALSANDALGEYKSTSNFIESLPELPELLRSVKDLSKLGKIILHIKNGDPRAIKELFDFLASTYLLYKYGAKPSASDVKEVKDLVSNAERRLLGLESLGATSMYGQFSYELPHKGPYDSSVDVDVRTKMVIRSSPLEAIGNVLALDSVGLLPTLTRIWDLVPWSFVVDWFTSLSEKFSNIDSTLERVALDVDYYVHTYTYKFYVSDAMLFPFSGIIGDVKPHYRVFLREKSRYHPVLVTSHYDFLPPRGIHKRNILAAGSLVWVSL